MEEIGQSSVVAADPAAVWQRIVTFEGVNHELGPWMRMTAPADVRARGLENVVLGERICRSWVFLLGVIPFDYDDLTLVELEPGRRFLERSKMLSQRSWEHERTLEPAEGGTRVTDRLRFEPRLSVLGGLSARVIQATFAHRHRRLADFFA